MANNVVKYLLSVVLLFTAVYGMAAKVEVPEKPNPPRLVNDYANIFSASQVKLMEDSLSAFARKTSNQIVVVTMSELGGYSPNEMATEIGHKWGVGQKDLDNGVVILIKPKNSTSGEVFIAPGYGLEGALPDAFCWDIINNEMLPRFKENDYYGGVKAALGIIQPVVAGEYSYEAYKNEHEDPWWVTVGALLFIIGIVYVFYKFAGRGGSKGTGGVATALFLGSMMSNGRGHSSGGSSGFGGFGGGGFGGGGAGGSW